MLWDFIFVVQDAIEYVVGFIGWIAILLRDWHAWMSDCINVY